MQVQRIVDLNGNTVANAITQNATPDSQTFLSFGLVNVFTAASQTFRIRNVGTFDLSVTSIVSNSVDFVVACTATCPPSVVTTVDSTGIVFSVTISPIVTGPFSATITIANSDFNLQTFVFTITATGTGTNKTGSVRLNPLILN